MTAAQPNLLLRNDTIFGVCEAIGHDFGFHPNWLRVALASMIYFSPLTVIGVYFALGVVVAASRWIAPDELVAASAEAPELLEAGPGEGGADLQMAA